MSETTEQRTPLREDLDSMAGVHADVHVHNKTDLAVTAYPSEQRVVLRMGDGRSTAAVYLDSTDLDRLHAVIHDAFAHLDRPTIYAADEAPEAYASGWDAAIAWVQDSTDEPVPASVPGGSS